MFDAMVLELVSAQLVFSELGESGLTAQQVSLQGGVPGFDAARG